MIDVHSHVYFSDYDADREETIQRAFSGGMTHMISVGTEPDDWEQALSITSYDERIRAAVEQEKKQVVEAADAEISAASRTARRELKAFAADLAVNLAGQRIQVDQATDEGLVRSFTAKLGAVDGKDGH